MTFGDLISNLVYTLFGLFTGGISLGFYIGYAVGRGQLQDRLEGRKKRKK